MVSLASSLSTAALLHQDPHHHGLVGVCGGVQGCASRHLLSLSRVVDLLLWTCRVGARSPVQQGLHGLQVPHGSGHHECRGPAVPVASAQAPSYRSREMTWAWPMVAAECRAVVPSLSLAVSGMAPSANRTPEVHSLIVSTGSVVLTAAGRPRSSAPGRSDEDDEVADELCEEEDKDLEVNGLQGCGERGKTY